MMCAVPLSSSVCPDPRSASAGISCLPQGRGLVRKQRPSSAGIESNMLFMWQPSGGGGLQQCCAKNNISYIYEVVKSVFCVCVKLFTYQQWQKCKHSWEENVTIKSTVFNCSRHQQLGQVEATTAQRSVNTVYNQAEPAWCWQHPRWSPTLNLLHCSLVFVPLISHGAQLCTHHDALT